MSLNKTSNTFISALSFGYTSAKLIISVANGNFFTNCSSMGPSISPKGEGKSERMKK
jgi:hypothetical protein